MGFISFQNGINGISIPGTAYEFEVNCSEGTVRSLNNGLGFQLRKRQGQFDEILDAQFPTFERKSGTVGCIEDIVERNRHRYRDTGQHSSRTPKHRDGIRDR